MRGTYITGPTVQSSAPEPRGYLAFQPGVHARRMFDWTEMAEGKDLKSNLLWI